MRAFWAIGGFAVACLAAEQPRETFATARTVSSSCQKATASAVPIFVKHGFYPKTSDANAGFMDLEYRKGEVIGSAFTSKQINDLVKRYTKQTIGFWSQYQGFRFASATAIFAPKGDGCEITLNAVVHGWEKRLKAGNRAGWWILESNGRMESEVLADVPANPPSPP